MGKLLDNINLFMLSRPDNKLEVDRLFVRLRKPRSYNLYVLLRHSHLLENFKALSVIYSSPSN